MKNEVMLITYADSLGGNLKEMEKILQKNYQKAISSIHILPFFPSSADRGFAPLCYERVDEKFGDFTDLERLGKNYDLMYDFMVNHISAQSPYYQDFKEKKICRNIKICLFVIRSFGSRENLHRRKLILFIKENRRRLT